MKIANAKKTHQRAQDHGNARDNESDGLNLVMFKDILPPSVYHNFNAMSQKN